MRERSVCFTGHRMIKDLQELDGLLRQAVFDLIEEGYDTFLAGGAQGFDTLAAETVLKLREKYPHIRLHLVLPHARQAKGWPAEEQMRYERIKAEADSVNCISEDYFRGCMHRRNRMLVEGSCICVCYLAKECGGTFYTVNYARRMCLTVINLADGMELR